MSIIKRFHCTHWVPWCPHYLANLSCSREPHSSRECNHLLLTCSSVSWSWSHCLVCWKPSGEGWQSETCKIMGLIRFGGLCAIWLVWRGSHFKALKHYLRSSYTLTVQQSRKYFSTVNKPLGCLVLWWLDQATAPTSYVACHTCMCWGSCSNVQ